MKIVTCYMCENLSTTDEHAPPKCIFPQSESKNSDKNLRKIKVPSCDLHNSVKSKDDEYLLYVLTTTITSSNVGLNHFYDKTIRAAKRRPKLSYELLKDSILVKLNDLEKQQAFDAYTLNIDKNRIDSVLEKCARAIYFDFTKSKLSGNANVICSFLLNTDNMKLNQQITDAILISEEIFNSIPAFGDYPNVFSYKILEDEKSVLIRLEFYGTTKVIVEIRKSADTTIYMINTNSIKTTLLLAATQLKTLSIDAETAKFEAQLLLQHALKVNRAWLIAHENDALEANIHGVFEALLHRRLNGEPMAYILGTREFYGLNLKVTADTLIPRADTETLVEAALTKIALPVTPSPQPSPTEGEGVTKLSDSAASPRPLWERARERGSENITILDLGTGTGAIALTIAKHRPQAHVTALDASQAALNIAIENAQNLNISNVKFILSDWFSALHGNTFDVIVSNPPYIETNDTHLKQGDLRFEPLSALASGEDGLDAIRTIITQAPQYLNPHGWLLLEHGYNQANKVADLLKLAGFSEIDHVKDLAGTNRVTLGQLN